MNAASLRRFALKGLASLCLAVTAGGCHSPFGHSAFIEATLVNHSGQPVRLVEMDYPSASFGTESLADGGSFHYRFKVIGQGPLKLSWTDARQREHNVGGPELHEGQRGMLTVTMGPAEQLAWQTTFR